MKPVFTDVSKNCADCHADIHRRQFGANCTQCHTPGGWNVAVQSIKNHTNRFPLLGAHATVECAGCHKNAAVGQYIGLSTACVSCHMTDFQKTVNPNHVLAKFSATCETCHTFDNWLNAKFDHGTTGFLLTNGHANLACESCHINNNYNLVIAPADCGNSQCHLITWQGTTTPVHRISGPAYAAANCATCHTTLGWTGAAFNHSATGFALIGTHMSPTPTACVACHVGGNYTLNSTDCYGCHQAAFNSTAGMGGNVLNHVASGFPITASACATCHPITTWAAGLFDHSATGFLLTNGHAGVACVKCHVNNNYALTIAPADCGNSQCHLTTWNGTTTPMHKTSGLAFAAANCNTCHTTLGWAGAAFNHSTTGFTLTGLHISPSPTPCISCHVNNNYLLSSTACYGCHLDKWQGTASPGYPNVPNHITAGFPQDCSVCHSTSNWTTSTFNHNTTTFPLFGTHVTTPCASCHVGGNYSGTLPTACIGCHNPEFQSTATPGFAGVPNHVALSYPTTCASCHNMTNWLNAVFDHNTTGFPLTGAHITTACSLCHITTAKPPIDCYSCHTVAWQSTANLGGQVPNHMATDAAAAGIVPATCATCHNTTNWLGGTFTHSWWSTSHGNARGICANCHSNSMNYVIFMCSNGSCHTRPGVDNSHRGNSSYVYSTGATCYACHKNGG